MTKKQKDTNAQSSDYVVVAGYKIPKSNPNATLTTVKVNGVKLELEVMDLLEKYRAQKLNDYFEFSGSDTYAESPKEEKKYAAYENWGKDGQPTGITSDEEFYAIQEALWPGRTLITLEPEDDEDDEYEDSADNEIVKKLLNGSKNY